MSKASISALTRTFERPIARNGEDPEFRDMLQAATAGLASFHTSSVRRSLSPALVVRLEQTDRLDAPAGPGLTARAMGPVVVLALIALVVSLLQARTGHREPALVADASRFVHAGAHTPSDGRFLITAVSRTTSDDAQRSERIIAMRVSRKNAMVAAADCLGPRRDLSELSISSEGFTGGSAGLMLALSVVDAFRDADLTRGRDIAGTGTIARDGTVGRVLHIDLKARAAERAGADLFLVPAAQLAEARRAVTSLPVAAVRTLDDAVCVLSGSGCPR